MLSKFWALLVGALLHLSTPALAVVVITEDGGGIINEFEQRYATFKASNEFVILDGMCASACTLVFNIMPRENVCVTERAKLGFHSAYTQEKGMAPEFSALGTDMLWKALPPAVKDALRAKGWDGGELEGWKEGNLIWLEGTELQQFYRLCTDEDFNPWKPEVSIPASEPHEPGYVLRFVRWLLS